MSSLNVLTAADALYLATMVSVIVGGDFLFFRHQLWPRLSYNVGVVLVFSAFYFRYLHYPRPTATD